MANEQAQSYTIGVDLGGTNLRIAAYTRDAGLLETILLPTRLAAGRDAVVDDLCGAVTDLQNRFSSRLKLFGIGVGTPGPLELPAGRLHNPPTCQDGMVSTCGANSRRNCSEVLWLSRMQTWRRWRNVSSAAGFRWASIPCACSRLEPA